MKQNLLVTLADEKFIMQAKQLFASAFWNGGWSGDYMLLSHQISDEKLQWFIDKGILIKKCNPIQLKTLKLSYEPVVLDKFYLFTEEFKIWDTIIFLDSDIIVKSSLEYLLKVKYFGAAKDSYSLRLKSQFFDTSKNQINERKFNFNRPAFNSGVMVFKSSIIKPTTFSDLTELTSKYSENFKFGEQPALNLYFYQKWESIPPIFNVFITNHGYKLPKSLKCVAIHFFARFNEFSPVWDTRNSYFTEWKGNLEKADRIDLNYIPKVETLSLFDIRYNSLILKLSLHKHRFFSKSKSVYFYIYYKALNFKYFLLRLIYLPDRMMGFFGKILKKRNPKLYMFLKKNNYGK